MANSIKPEPPILEFATTAAWREWLEKNAQISDGIWLKFYRTSSSKTGLAPAAALDEALCYGWINGTGKKYDAESYLARYTPRRKASLWSKLNIEHVERLTKAGKMTAAGQAEIDRAKADGRWDAAYDKPSNMKVPTDFIKALEAHPKAKRLFQTLNKTNLYTIAWRLQTARTDATRQRRQDAILAKLDAGETFH